MRYHVTGFAVAKTCRQVSLDTVAGVVKQGGARGGDGVKVSSQLAQREIVIGQSAILRVLDEPIEHCLERLVRRGLVLARKGNQTLAVEVDVANDRLRGQTEERRLFDGGT
jgi:hypothetical protein